MLMARAQFLRSSREPKSCITDCAITRRFHAQRVGDQPAYLPVSSIQEEGFSMRGSAL
jgi:hypothetical protein